MRLFNLTPPSRDAVVAARTSRFARRPRRNQYMIVAAAGLLTLAAAAAVVANSSRQQRTRPGEIPVGEWSGDGVFVFEHWAPGEAPTTEDQPEELDAIIPDLDDEDGRRSSRNRAVHRRYRTRLEIWTERLGRFDVAILEIESKRGELADLGDETHLVVALSKVRRVSGSTTLYRVIAFAFNPEPDDEPIINEMAPPVSASCTTIDDTTVLQIHYMNNFVDTFRFEGDHLEKTGLYHTDTGMVHWNERLERR